MTKDNEIDERFATDMKALAIFVDEIFNGNKKGADKEVGFFVAVYPFGHEGRFNYISNSERKDVIVLLKEVVARFEGQPHIKGTA